MPDELSPEDRERLVDAKFGELFDRWWEKRFSEAFDKRVIEMQSASGKPQSSQRSSAQQEYRPKRRSLLEEVLNIG